MRALLLEICQMLCIWQIINVVGAFIFNIIIDSRTISSAVRLLSMVAWWCIAYTFYRKIIIQYKPVVLEIIPFKLTSALFNFIVNVYNINCRFNDTLTLSSQRVCSSAKAWVSLPARDNRAAAKSTSACNLVRSSSTSLIIFSRR